MDEISQALKEGRLPRRRWEWSLDLIGRLRAAEGTGLDASVYTAVLHTFEVSRQWQPALRLLEEMRAAALVPELASYTATIRACEHGMQWQWTVELLADMRRLNLVADAATYGASISVCDRARQPLRALRLLDMMREEGLQPGLITYSIAAGACRGKLRDVLAQAKDKGLTQKARRKKKRVVL